jgi:hypothetical protein
MSDAMMSPFDNLKLKYFDHLHPSPSSEINTIPLKQEILFNASAPSLTHGETQMMKDAIKQA